ncbi:hypothetical protein [Magnetovibrio sp.]|uniref:hypothetical protein n=1 Tax=Magnetovibrio sp. TaxID=2024836 RepID=UPI002F92A81A
MMSAFDIPKNLVALLGALALAALFATANPAQAEETTDQSSAASATTSAPTTAHHIEQNTLRKLLSAPHLSREEHLQLLIELNELNEEVA